MSSNLQQYDLSEIESCCENIPEFLIIYKFSDKKEPLKVCKYHYSKFLCFNDEKVIKEKYPI